MTGNGQSGPSLFSSSLSSNGPVGDGILASLSVSRNGGDGWRRDRAGRKGLWWAGALFLLSGLAYLSWQGEKAEKALASSLEHIKKPLAVEKPDRLPVAADLEPAAVGGPARIVVATGDDQPASKGEDATTVSGPQPAIPDSSRSVIADPKPAADSRSRPALARVSSPSPLAAVIAEPAVERPDAAAHDDEDVRLLAALMGHKGVPVEAEEAAHRALRECGALAPSDREACVAALCAAGRAPASSCGAAAVR